MPNSELLRRDDAIADMKPDADMMRPLATLAG